MTRNLLFTKNFYNSTNYLFLYKSSGMCKLSVQSTPRGSFKGPEHFMLLIKSSNDWLPRLEQTRKSSPWLTSPMWGDSWLEPQSPAGALLCSLWTEHCYPCWSWQFQSTLCLKTYARILPFAWNPFFNYMQGFMHDSSQAGESAPEKSLSWSLVTVQACKTIK